MKIIKRSIAVAILYLVLFWAIQFTGEGAPYLVYFLNYPFIEFLKFEGALRVSWIGSLLPVFGFIFYFLGTLCIGLTFCDTKYSTLFIAYLSFFIILFTANYGPIIAGKIYRTWTVAKITNTSFPNIDNSEICKNSIVYASQISGGGEIWSMDEYGQNKINLSKKNPYPNKISFDTGPKWSPDGKIILFSAERNTVYGVYIMSCDGSIQYMVAKTFDNNNYPEWSPDGKLIVYSDIGSLRVVDYTGKNDRPIIPRHTFGPSFSPDGKQIAYCFKPDSSGGYECNIELINLDGTNLRTLIADGNYNFNPKWIKDDIISYSTDLGQYKTNFSEFKKNMIIRLDIFLYLLEKRWIILKNLTQFQTSE